MGLTISDSFLDGIKSWTTTAVQQQPRRQQTFVPPNPWEAPSAPAAPAVSPFAGIAEPVTQVPRAPGGALNLGLGAPGPFSSVPGGAVNIPPPSSFTVTPTTARPTAANIGLQFPEPDTGGGFDFGNLVRTAASFNPLTAPLVPLANTIQDPGRWKNPLDAVFSDIGNQVLSQPAGGFLANTVLNRDTGGRVTPVTNPLEALGRFTEGENFLSATARNVAGPAAGEAVTGGFDFLREQGLAGRVGANVLNEVASPFTLAAAALGGPLAAKLAPKLGPLGRGVASVLEPVGGGGASTGRALVGEALTGAAARTAAETTQQLLPENTPLPLRLGASLGAGLLGGGLTARAFGNAPAATRGTVLSAVEEGGAAAGKTVPPRTIIDVPTGVVNPVKMMEELPPNPTPRAVTSLMQEYEGTVGTAGLELKRTLDDGRDLLKAAGVRGTWDGSRFTVRRTPEVEALYKALHGEGPVPPKYQAVYDDLQRLVAEEGAETIAADPNFIPRDDYFYRGWKQPKQAQVGGKGQVGTTPGYKKPRVDATFSELLDEGWEPASWNPYEMVALRRRAGVEYRAQQELVEQLKTTGLAMDASVAPSGWRVPQVGPAFEGKPFAYIPSPNAGDAAARLAASEEVSGAALGYTPRLAVPNKVADILEGVYGRRPNMGALQPVLTAGNRFKQAKLLASLFQQVDFAGRTVGSLTGGAIDELTESVISAAKMQPSAAARHLYQAGRNVLRVPAAPFKLLHANASPAQRRRILDQILDSTEPLMKERPGVTVRSIAEQGGFADDISIVTRDIVADIRQAAEEGPPSWLREVADKNAVTRTVRQINAASQNGLFDGVYHEAKVLSLKHDIVPRLVRQHPDWSDKQIAQEAANLVNMRFSTITRSQDIIKNPVIRELTRGLIFSTNEPQALIRGALSTVAGGNKRNWANYWAGAFLALGATAELIHYASTGEHLPLDRLVPVEKNKYSPFGVSYNNQFLAPDLPIKGRNGVLTSLDLVAQLDTIFRVLDPKGFIQSRENVIPRAIANQVAGKDFFGEALDSPRKRVEQAISDLVEPIGVSQIRSALGLGKETEARLGGIAQAIQGTGLNLRAETSPDLRDRMARQYAENVGISDVQTWDDLEPAQQREALDAFPEIANELQTRGEEAAARGSEGAKTMQQNTQITAEFTEAQLRDDAALARNEMTPKEWKLARESRLWALRNQRDVVFSSLTDRQPDDATDRYYQAIEDATFDATRQDGVDWDKVDAWLAQQTPADQAEIARNTGLSGTPQEQRYREQTKLIADSGYFDLSDQIAVEFAKTLGLAVSGRAELETYVRTQLTKELQAEGLSASDINTLRPALERMLLSDYTSALSKLRDALRQSSPEVAAALIETGRWEPGLEAATNLLSQSQ